MSQPLKNIVNIMVFMRFHIFDVFINLMIFGANLDLFWSLLETLGHQFGDFLGYCTGIEISRDLRVSPDPPQVA